MASTPPAPEGGDDLSIRGEIETTSVPELLRTVAQSGETGLLRFRSGEATKTIFVQQGRVVYAGSNNPDERLGEVLLLHGRITARQYIEASALIRPGRRLGAILVELGALESDELIPAVEAHVKEILMDLFTWTSGEYEFTIRELKPSEVVILSLSTENLILEGMRRTRAWSRVLRGIGGLDTIPVPAGRELAYKLELSEDEQELLAHVNGRSTVEQICQVSYLTDFETCRMLWAFKVLGVIRAGQADDVVAAGAGAREREEELDLQQITEQYNQMFSRIHQFLKGRIGDQADALVDAVMEEVSRQYGVLFAGIDLKHYGRADFDQMLANVADLPAEQRRSLMVAALNELVFAIQLNVRIKLGKEEEAVVSGIVRDGLKRVGPADQGRGAD